MGWESRLWAMLLSLCPSRVRGTPPPLGTFIDLLGPPVGSPWVLGPASKPGWESEDEGELLVPGAHRASARGLGSMVKAEAHCLLKGRCGGGSFYRGRTWKRGFRLRRQCHEQ